MPPSSRKRNKGKERKAKKADKVEIERASANEFWQGWRKDNVGCMHGSDASIADNHPVSKFIDEFFIQWRRQKKLADILQDMLLTHSQVWKDDNDRELVTHALTTIGTNMLLMDDYVNKGALDIAKTISLLEHYDSSEGPGLSSSLYSRPAASKLRDIENGTISIKRDLLKFYRKRISCKCLKRMHLDARKTIPKMGRCYYCNVEKQRASLFVCSECMVSQYCSRECQVANWPRHEFYCDAYVNVKVNKHEEKEMAETEQQNNDKESIRLSKEELEEKKSDIEELERLERWLEEGELEKKKVEHNRRS